jgi:hypothetical protein
MPTRHLTKSRFKLGLECPTKLFYTRKDEYTDAKQHDTFLANLAEGGHLVGALAKLYFPGGHDITTLDTDESLQQTAEFMQQKDVVIYEPAFRWNNLFVRVDVLIKQGQHVKLIEVKSKSIDTSVDDPFRGAQGKIKSDWLPYIMDVAFQRYVLTHSLPADLGLSAYLMLIDKTCECTVDGLNQMFEVTYNQDRKEVNAKAGVTQEDVCCNTLVQYCVDSHIDQATSDQFENRSFEEHIDWLSSNYLSDTKITPELGAKCKKCEFRTSREQRAAGKRDGFRECWSETLGWTDEEFSRPQIYNIWNYRRLDACIKAGRTRLDLLDHDDIPDEPDDKAGLSAKQRRATQVRFALEQIETSYVDSDPLRQEIEAWVFPLHFIDFETAAPAVPMHQNLKPNEMLAFQYSHHVVHEDGTVEHAGEFLEMTPGGYPNVEFIRQLKSELEADNGTIFRYSHYENTVLNHVMRQLDRLDLELPDRDELFEFIRSITQSTQDNVDAWNGDRNMVDLYRIQARYYYHPLTRGSQSIKYVLPAILNDSQYLQEKYSQPVYGAAGGIVSKNFSDWTWVERGEDGLVRDPYERLGPVFSDISMGHWEYLKELDNVADGGTARTAYMRMQNESLPEEYRQEIAEALLRYCELDTMAMVMLYEGWREMV